MKRINHITLNTVDENQKRIHAALIAVVSTTYILSGSLLSMYILVYDLFAYIYMTSVLSPLYLISANVVRFIGFKPKLIDASEKEFASHIGLTLLLTALYAELTSHTSIALSLVLFFTLWKVFEATREICIACVLYKLLRNKNIEVESL